jgi:hypothetical protein
MLGPRAQGFAGQARVLTQPFGRLGVIAVVRVTHRGHARFGVPAEPAGLDSQTAEDGQGGDGRDGRGEVADMRDLGLNNPGPSRKGSPS